ncbi:MAG: aminopeptidase N [Myxococcota bacterium]|jgi:aminopeptidase N
MVSATVLALLCLQAPPAASVPFAPSDVRAHEPPSTPIDFLHLDARITIEPEKGTIAGTATHTLQAVGQSRSQVTLHAAPDLKITSVATADGVALTSRRAGDRLIIDLKQPAVPGSPVKIVVVWSGSPRNGMHFVTAEVGKPRHEVWTQGETEFARGWIPVWDYPNDRFTSALAVRVPKAYQANANGRLLGVDTDGAYRVFRWSMAHDHVAYLLSVNVGRFITLDDPRAKKPLVHFMMYPEQKATHRLHKTASILQHMVELTGMEYPFSRYGTIVASHFSSGGMENITTTTLRADLAAYSDSVAHVYSADGLIAHEAAHMWFGDIVTCRDWAHIWLNEGFATYYTALYFERAEGDERFQRMMRGLAGSVIGESKRYERPVVTYRFEQPGAMFDAHTYAKGAWVLHMLRQKLGKELFLKGVGQFLKKHRFGLAETADLRRALEEASGQNLRAFFDQWLHTPGHVRANVTITAALGTGDSEPGDSQIGVQVVQTGEARRFTLRARLLLANGKTQDLQLKVSEAKHQFELKPPSPVLAVELDPNLQVLRALKITAPPALLIHQLRRGSTTTSRIDAAKALGTHRGAAVQTALHAALTAAPQQPDVRSAAARSLAKIAADTTQTAATRDAVCAQLGSRLNVDMDAHVRRAIAGTLKACPKQSGALEKAASDRSVHVAAAALGSLAAHDKPPMSRLKRALKTPSWNGLLAKAVADGLAGHKDKRALDVLLAAASARGIGPRDRGRILGALGKLAGASDPAVVARARQALLKRLTSETEPYVVRAVMGALVRVGQPSDRRALDAAAARIPGKWTHKLIDRWRRQLKARPQPTP